jgi:hypothetical protein
MLPGLCAFSLECLLDALNRFFRLRSAFGLKSWPFSSKRSKAQIQTLWSFVLVQSASKSCDPSLSTAMMRKPSCLIS